MSEIKIISFDLEGTLTTPDFSLAVWYQGIPSLYAELNRIPFAEALAYVKKNYQEIGDKRLEWYDIKYWCDLFHIGPYTAVLDRYQSLIANFPDAIPALSSLQKNYKLIVSTNTAREFLPYLLDGIEKYFQNVFSSVSDYNLIKCPEFYTRLSQDLSVPVQEIVHVGDSREFDWLASHNAGMQAFYLDRSRQNDGFNSVSNLTELKAKLTQA